MRRVTSSHPDLVTLKEWLIQRIAGYLELSTSEIDPSVPLAESGIDSVAALNLCGDIEDTWGVEVDPTLAYEYPTIVAIARHLHGVLAARAEPAA